VVRAADAAGMDELWLWEDCFSESRIALAAAGPVPAPDPRPCMNPAPQADRLSTGWLLALVRLIHRHWSRSPLGEQIARVAGDNSGLAGPAYVP
jgi:hypothetical protein